MTDEEIIKKIQEGELLEFEEIVKRYQGKLIAFVGRIMGDYIDAEEVVQDSFLKLYKNIDYFDTKRKFSSYVFTITRNEAISFLRKNRKDLSLDQVPEVSIENDLTDELFREEEDEKLRESLKKLSFGQRRALELYYFEEYSYKEIAAKLKLPINTVRTNIKRGKDTLKRIIENEK